MININSNDAFPTERAKVLAALSRYRLEPVTDPSSALFEAAYDMLDRFFGARGELEEREVLRGFVRQREMRFGEGLLARYHLIAAWCGRELVGVRDCYSEIDPARRLCLVSLSHSFVTPEHRRTGLASLFRTCPVSLARDMMREHFPDPEGVHLLVTAEMDAITPEDQESFIRLMAYGRAGFSVIDPSYVPYAQPDFRDVEALGLPHWGIPLLALVRRVGHEGERTLPVELAAAFPRHYNSFHKLFLPQERVDTMLKNALETLARRNVREVPLLPLPTRPEEQERLAPLYRSAVLPFYPEKLRGGGGSA